MTSQKPALGNRPRSLRDALIRAGERFHGLSDDPPHIYNMFSECPDDYCVEVRDAVHAHGIGELPDDA